jgi:hypothetical protein
VRVPAAVVPTISIFVDPELEGQEPPPEHAEAPSESSNERSKGIRKQLDLAPREQLRAHTSVTDSERIASNPLSKHKASEPADARDSNKPEPVKAVETKPEVKLESRNRATDSISKAPAASIGSAKSTTAKLSAAVKVDNSMESAPAPAAGAFAIFSDSTSDVPQKSLSKPTTSAAPAFTVFSDVAAEEPKGIAMKSRPAVTASKPKSASVPQAPANSFSIFSDETSAPTASKKPVAVMTPTTSSNSGAGFSIFCDSKETGNPQAPALPAKQAQPTFAIFSDSDVDTLPAASQKKCSAVEVKGRHIQATSKSLAPAVNTPQRQELIITAPDISIHEDDLDNLLTEMGILDEEDGTINTRLAKQDIDSMFCSPGTADITRNPKKATETQIGGSLRRMKTGSDDWKCSLFNNI